MTHVGDVRRQFVALREIHPEGNAGRTIEIVGASFEVTADHIFGAPATDWLRRETDWYMSQSLNIGTIEGGVPPAWRASASPDLAVLSNYGWALLSEDNYDQYGEVVSELRRDPESRQATAVYARPSMYEDARALGCRDVFCTLGVSYLQRDRRLDAVVHMRSSDAVRGFRGDVHWQRLVQERIAAELGVAPGRLIWQASSFHIYEGDWHLIDHYAATGEHAAPVKRWAA